MSVENWNEALNSCLVHHCRDWAASKRDAWIYGIIVGWADESLVELQGQHGWDDEALIRLKQLRLQYVDSSVCVDRRVAMEEAPECNPNRAMDGTCFVCGSQSEPASVFPLGSAFLFCAKKRFHCDVKLCHFNKLRIEVGTWGRFERLDIPIGSTEEEVAKAIMDCATKLADLNA